MKLSKTSTQVAAIAAIVFLAYNITLFVICGFSGHTSVFWISWIFMLLAFAAIGCVCAVINFDQKGYFLRDWLFGYPFVKHSTVFAIAEFCASTLFIILEHQIKWGLAFAVLFLFLCIYGVFAISCFIAKDTIEHVQTEVKEKTSYMKLLRVDAESLYEKCSDPETKEECRKLLEAVRYSDPMSNELLADLEQSLSQTISECNRAVSENDYPLAKELCAKAMLLVSERNRKCRALK